jgi:hypothetical protein
MYIIEPPPMSPIKLHIEIPISEMSGEDLALRIAQIKMATYNLPKAIMSARIKDRIIAALRSE